MSVQGENASVWDRLAHFEGSNKKDIIRSVLNKAHLYLLLRIARKGFSGKKHFHMMNINGCGRSDALIFLKSNGQQNFPRKFSIDLHVLHSISQKSERKNS